ncbi:glycoside hydrolase superfamily [Staphylotrichum tortipilum]|uniref:non-reducing end alpha-L-arabinofuranosidase n=1 Tax=Staphylotrichum tortipilum TaxID=2831512 RepID=A0AAN6MRI2_9PEZI|nr:glycoside hydrolase superfamily [Staphylotrichum longicolle]
MRLLQLAVASAVAPALALATSSCSAPEPEPVNLLVRGSGGNKTTHMMYGIMHEDINNSGDGGIYAELIQNRAFQATEQYPVSLDSWLSVNGAKLAVKQLTKPLSAALPNSLNVVPGSGKKTGFANTGFWGMDVKVQKYTGSFYVKGAYSGQFTASLQSNLTGETFGSVDIKSRSVANEWVQHEFTLVPKKNAPNSNNTFAITFDTAGAKQGSLDFNLISLFPPTYKNRPNGLRVDLMEAIAELKPTFFRLPGGNMLEGLTTKTWWKWNETIGPLKDRPGMAGVWNYQVTTGLGLVEYMEWCDDLNMEPIVAVWDGLALDGNYISKEDLGPYIQSALDEIEFLTGSVETKWGKVRASLGHPKPWKVNYVEIGNEDWLAGRPTAYETYKQYRFKMFQDAFTKKYPHIQIIASPSVFDDMVIPVPAAGDYHPYLRPDEFVENFNKFDHLTKDNLTLIGEYAAVHPNGGIDWAGNLHPWPWWGGAVSEAIFLISAERNSDRVIGATYAPGLRNLNRWQWSITLMQHAADPALTTKSVSWHVSRLFSNHIIRETLPVSTDANFGPLYYVAGTSEKGTSIWKGAVYNSTEPVDVSLQFECHQKNDKATLTVLTGPTDPYGYNDPWTQVNVVKEKTTTIKADDKGKFSFSLPGLSVAVLETEGKAKCKGKRRIVADDEE